MTTVASTAGADDIGLLVALRATCGAPLEEIRHSWGISQNTLKTRVRRVLNKVDAVKLHDAGLIILRGAFKQVPAVREAGRRGR